MRVVFSLVRYAIVHVANLVCTLQRYRKSCSYPSVQQWREILGNAYKGRDRRKLMACTDFRCESILEAFSRSGFQDDKERIVNLFSDINTV